MFEGERNESKQARPTGVYRSRHSVEHVGDVKMVMNSLGNKKLWHSWDKNSMLLKKKNVL